MKRTLANFPEAFVPLVVVVGDRRESGPKTCGDLLAFSGSIADMLYVNSLGLPKDTLVISDKTFVVESPEFLREKFSRFNILTIGSPAANLFSRMINDRALFRFEIDEEAKAQMARQENIVRDLATDLQGLGIYKAILEGAKGPEEMPDVIRGKVPLTDELRARFTRILATVRSTGLKSYTGLLNSFAGISILNPVVDGKIDSMHAKRTAFNRHPWNDFGFVSIAQHPYAQWKQGPRVIYVAGRGAPATAHGVHWLADKTRWAERMYGGVFEVVIQSNKCWTDRFQQVNVKWDSEPYAPPRSDWPVRRVGVFISVPLALDDRQKESRARWLQDVVERSVGSGTVEVKCQQPYDLVNQYSGSYNFVNIILGRFKPCEYAVHDITSYSPGVMFEVGCSIGLRKPMVLIWNTTQAPYKHRQSPDILRFVEVACIGASRSADGEKTLRKAIGFMRTPGDCERCPGATGQRRQSCQLLSNGHPPVPRETDVFVVVAPGQQPLRQTLIEQIRKMNLIARTPEDFSGSPVCAACQGVVSCGKVVADVTKGDPSAIIALGMARVRERHALQLYEESSEPVSMFDGPSRKWRRKNLREDIKAALKTLA